VRFSDAHLLLMVIDGSGRCRVLRVGATVVSTGVASESEVVGGVPVMGDGNECCDQLICKAG
jgi:hypothetical protein